MLKSIIRDKKIDLNKMSINEIIAFIKENPSVLKRPIMVDSRRIQVGYNSEEIMTFIPRARRIACEACTPENCAHYPYCDHVQ